MNFDSFDEGYITGWDEGRKIGYDEGWADAFNEAENRLAKYWAEIQTLNARVDYISNQLDKNEK